MLSRTERYRAMRLEQKAKQRKTRRKFFIALFSLITITAVSTNLSLANADIAGLVESWFQKKAEIMISDIDRQINQETDIQKQRLVKEIELSMAASDESINRFTEEQKLLYKSQLEHYADQLIAGLDFSNEEDRARIQASLGTILSSARAAMDDLAQNYTPPAVQQPTPQQPEESPPAADTPASAVDQEPSPEAAEPVPNEVPTTEQPDAPNTTEQPVTESQAPAAETESQTDSAAPVTTNE